MTYSLDEKGLNLKLDHTQTFCKFIHAQTFCTYFLRTRTFTFLKSLTYFFENKDFRSLLCNQRERNHVYLHKNSAIFF